MAENSPPSRLDDGSTSKKPVSLLENRPGRKKRPLSTFMKYPG